MPVIIQWHFGPITPEKFPQGLRSSAADSFNFGGRLVLFGPESDTTTLMSHLCRPTSAHPTGHQ